MLKFVIVTVLAATAYGSLKPVVYHDRSGTEDNSINGKIVGGINANEGEFPYIVSLKYKGAGQACGASILTPDWVMTAAHCCSSGKPLEVYAGSIYLSSGGQTYSIKQYIINGDYDASDYWKNDICLINLSTPIQFNENAQPAKLPPRDLVINSGDSLTIPGWGNLLNGHTPDRLQVLNDDKAWTNEECTNKTFIEIFPGQLCTNAGKGLAVCNGDSGGPLSQNGVQVGLTSWGYQPCGNGMPDVFTRISYYIDWIEEVLGSSAKDLQFATPEDLL